MPLIAPSILAADFSHLADQITLAVGGGADWIHLDVMDGHFVPNLTFGPPVIRAIRPVTTVPFDTHLMIQNPDQYIDEYRRAGADLITVHVEATPHLHRTVQRIRQSGARAGVSLNPATPVSSVHDILGEVDLVLLMSVNPGFGGQAFIPASIGRLRELAAMIRDDRPAHRARSGRRHRSARPPRRSSRPAPPCSWPDRRSSGGAISGRRHRAPPRRRRPGTIV